MYQGQGKEGGPEQGYQAGANTSQQQQSGPVPGVDEVD